MRRAVVVLAAPLLLAGCGLPVLPAGPTATEALEVPTGVTSVRLEGRGYLELTAGPESLEVTGGRDLLEEVRVRADGGELVLSLDERGLLGRRGTVTYRLTLPEWVGLASSGSGDVRASGDGGDDPLRITVSGSGEVLATDVDRDELDVQVSGSGDAEVTGRAVTQRVSVSGSGSFEGSELRGEEVDVRVSGSGDASVVATRRLDARVSGSGDVVYGGDPQSVVSSTTGSGTVTPR